MFMDIEVVDPMEIEVDPMDNLDPMEILDPREILDPMEILQKQWPWIYNGLFLANILLKITHLDIILPKQN